MTLHDLSRIYKTVNVLYIMHNLYIYIYSNPPMKNQKLFHQYHTFYSRILLNSIFWAFAVQNGNFSAI